MNYMIQSIRKTHIFVILVLIISLMVHSLLKYFELQLHSHLLIIGILSAQNNFHLREVLRNSWLKNLPGDVSYYFIIGRHSCKIPPEDRLDEYSCEELQINIPDERNSGILQSGMFQCSEEGRRKQVFWGYTFVTLYDVVIHKIGVLREYLKGPLRITLRETASKKTLTTVYITLDDSNSEVLWKSSDIYLLPKGFEGQIYIEKNFTLDEWGTCGFNWKASGGFLRFLYLFNSPNELPFQFTSHTLSPFVLGFKIHGMDKLRKFLDLKSDRRKLWNESLFHLNQNLNIEAANKGDMLLLNTVDVYRNLPQKMLQFFKWIYYNKQVLFLLKTDDDTIINVPKVLKELVRISQNSTVLHEKIWWWSTFRVGWPVQTFGKWREDSYQSLTYPPFPCGSGYVLNYGAIKFLGRNAENLYIGYQGEDVALGIWLSSVNPIKEHTNSCIWNCGDSFEANVCNYPQLSTDQIIEVQDYLQNSNHVR